ncbi:MAG: ABC transporter substrate-binding protein, partial [Eubacteriales bacterium]|nr:ABC transporter substrate-binding protein [Eubacteriales bacterium]
IFEDLKLRQGYCLLIDREALCELTNGAAVPAYSMIYDNMMYFSQAAKDDFVANYANDAERGKALIAEAGWADTDGDGYLDKDGQMAEFTMYASTDPTRQIIVQGMQEQMKQYGFKMNIEAIDWNYVHEYLCANDYDMGIHSLEWAEPILILNCCFDDPNAANNSDAFYAAVEDAATTVDDQERSDKLGVIQIEMLHPEWNMIPVYSDVYYVAHSSALKGVNILQNGFIYWNDLAL